MLYLKFDASSDESLASMTVALVPCQWDYELGWIECGYRQATNWGTRFNGGEGVVPFNRPPEQFGSLITNLEWKE